MSEEQKPVKLDLGCGTQKQEGFIGVDCRPFHGVDQVVDLTQPWPWDPDSVDEVRAWHVVEHLTPRERIHFVNELHRVLKKGAKCAISVPYWNSERAYGDLTHVWPPVVGFWFYYLSAEWRKINAPHNDGYTCDFEASWGGVLRPDIAIRSQEYQQFAMANYRECWLDMIATLTKK